MRILVTGASGFVGTALVQRLLQDPAAQIVAAARTPPTTGWSRVEPALTGDLGPQTDWRQPLADTEVVVHLAARVHVMHDQAVDPLAACRRVNVEGTLRLARQAIDAGVRRFVYLSSIKVNGEHTDAGQPFRADDHVTPNDPYGISKLEAEKGLRALAAGSGLQVVILRPPLVYGPGVRANFRSMMGWLRRGLPLPLGAVNNRRSLIALDNLCDLIAICTQHPAATGQTFLASDGEDVSTPELLLRLGAALGTPARLLPLPAGLLQRLLVILGQRSVAQRLCASLQVDIGPTRALLGWQPPLSLDEGLRRTAQAFLAETAPHPK